MSTKFITVSIDIMHDKNLTPNQKFILAEIEQLSSLDKGCIASNKHFSELIGIKVQGVSNAINDLAKKGYIHIDNSNTVRNYGRLITIHSNVPPIHSNVESKENKTKNKTVNKHMFNSSVFKAIEVDKIVAYRKSIKSPLKSQKGYIGLENKIISIIEHFGFTLDEVLEIMALKEWQSVEVEWVKKDGHGKRRQTQTKKLKVI